MVLALILDALSGRSPLFRLERFFADKDVELLLGSEIPASKFNDGALGRVLDRLSAYGTNKILTAIALRAVQVFDLDTKHVHYDTTSHSVYGDYDLYEEKDHGQPFVITHGFSKAHRPDLKQFIQSLLCVDTGIPIYSKCESGNESDKILNGRLWEVIVEKMRVLGQDNFVYVTDTAEGHGEESRSAQGPGEGMPVPLSPACHVQGMRPRHRPGGGNKHVDGLWDHRRGSGCTVLRPGPLSRV